MTNLALAIEASNPVRAGSSTGAQWGGVALGRIHTSGTVDVLASEPLGTAGGADDDLVQSIDRVCRVAHVAPESIQRVAVSIGPGGYTSIRVAVTVGKLVAEVARARCIGVPTSDVVVRGVPEHLRRERRVVVCLAWKRDDVWRAIYDPGSVDALSAALVPVSMAVEEAGGGVLVADGRLVERLVGDGLPIDACTVLEPVFDPVVLLAASSRLPCVDPVELAPLYPRRPEAVRQWEKRKHPTR